jgi:hypothetical protein
MCQQQLLLLLLMVVCTDPLLASLQERSLAAVVTQQCRACLQLQAPALASCQACHPQPLSQQQQLLLRKIHLGFQACR